MDVCVRRDGKRYELHFEKGENIGGLHQYDEPKAHSGTTIRWKPDLDVFTDIDIPISYYLDTLKRQAVVNAGVTFRFRNEVSMESLKSRSFVYENGIFDYVAELAAATR